MVFFSVGKKNLLVTFRKVMVVSLFFISDFSMIILSLEKDVENGIFTTMPSLFTLLVMSTSENTVSQVNRPLPLHPKNALNSLHKVQKNHDFL